MISLLASLSVWVLIPTLAESAPTIPDSATTVAWVGDSALSYNDFKSRYEDYLVFTGVQDNVRARYAVLNNMVNEILLRRYDDNAKVYSDPEYKKELASAWTRTVLAFLKDQEVYAKITVTDRELREAYQRSKVKIAVRHLYAATEKEAENLYHLVKIGVSFEELAKQVFTDTTLRNNGGYLGYITWGQTDPEFERVAYSLKVGEVSRPVRTAEGYSIIRVDGRVEDPFATEYGFLNMKRKIERALKIDKKAPYEAAYLKNVFNREKMKFNDKALKAIYDDLEKTESGSHEVNPERRAGSQRCVEYAGRDYSQADIETKLFGTPEFDRKLVTNERQLKLAVTGLVMQDVLMGIAHAKGYDTTSYVAETYTTLANYIYLDYKRNEVLDLVPVADSEITSYYEKNIAYYTGERQMNVQEIIVADDQTAENLRRRLDSGEDFGDLAAKYSLRSWTSKNRGIMGLSPFSYFGELKDTLWNLPSGSVLGPVHFDKYYGLFRLLGREEGRPIDLALVRDAIVKAIRNEKGFPYMQRKLEALAKLTSVKTNVELVKNYTLKLAGN